MDVARDLVDRQLVDRDGRECGRIDDIWIEWDADGGRLGPLVSGASILLDQLGAGGRLLWRGGAPARSRRPLGPPRHGRLVSAPRSAPASTVSAGTDACGAIGLAGAKNAVTPVGRFSTVSATVPVKLSRARLTVVVGVAAPCRMVSAGVERLRV